MFVSFFPKPKLFFTSAAIWCLAGILFWFFGGEQLGAVFGLPPAAAEAPPVLGIPVLWTKPFLWFYIYFGFLVGAFYAFWRVYSPHPWQNWSILGSSLILFSTYLNVQIYVALNNWRGPFYDLFQKAITTPNSVSTGELYSKFAIYAWIGATGMGLFVITRFFVSHQTTRHKGG